MLVLAALLPALAAPPGAHAADRAFASRFTANDNGDIAIAANTTMTCPAAAVGCAAAQAGQDNGPVARPTTASRWPTSTSTPTPRPSRPAASTLSLPTGATVLFAGLYWGGDSSTGARNQVRFATPASSAYQALTAHTTGRRTASGVRLCAELPRGLVIVEAHSAGTVRGHRACWRVGALAPGERGAVRIHVRVASKGAGRDARHPRARHRGQRAGRAGARGRAALLVRRAPGLTG